MLNKKGVLPIYFFGIAWLVYAVAFGFASLAGILSAFLFSGVVFALVYLICPAKQPIAPQNLKINKTGDAEADAEIKKGLAYVKKLDELNITDGEIDAKVGKIKEIAMEIFNYVGKHPTSVPQISKFMDYYFPTAIKLLEAYGEMERHKERGENMAAAMAGVKSCMDGIITAFSNQLDGLYRDRAIDISTEIDVLKRLMASEGLDGAPGSGLKG